MTLATLLHPFAAYAVISTVGWIGWIIIGGLAGALAGRVVEGKGLGLIGDIITGIVGALILGFVSGLFLNTQIGIIGSFILALIGAVVLLWLVRMVTGNRAQV